jgi:hypothetical protein
MVAVEEVVLEARSRGGALEKIDQQRQLYQWHPEQHTPLRLVLAAPLQTVQIVHLVPFLLLGAVEVVAQTDSLFIQEGLVEALVEIIMIVLVTAGLAHSFRVVTGVVRQHTQTSPEAVVAAQDHPVVQEAMIRVPEVVQQ